jgi:UDP:flavonoid glycosyltransferase YjiC (YdhE family)
VSFVGGQGHFDPIVPIARAAAARGHEVAVFGEVGQAPAVEAAGFAFIPTGTPTEPRRYPLADPNPAEEDRIIREVFVEKIARTRTQTLREAAEAWRPDVVICDDVDFGAMLVAEQLGIACAKVVVIVSGSFLRPEVIAEPLNRIRADLGLPPDPELQMLARHLVLSPVPDRFRDPTYPLPPTGRMFRPFSWSDAPRGERPLVYLTLGTIFNMESDDLFHRVVAGLAPLPVDVLVTVGRHIDPDELGPQPDHVRVERFIPQAEVMPRCDVVVSHGGSGTVVGALAHGRPMVLIPMGADQPNNAARCLALGIARELHPVTITPDQVRDTVAGMLADHSYRKRATELRDEIAAQATPDDTVSLLESLTGSCSNDEAERTTTVQRTGHVV